MALSWFRPCAWSWNWNFSWTRNHPFTVACLTMALGLGGSVSASAKPAVPTPAKPHHWSQVGKASWYGHKFQGRRTASGEKFDMNRFTCAHRSLPIGTLLRVTNLRNKRTIVVRVNDRGPVPETVLVDLSYAAARRLGFTEHGVAKVRIDKVSPVEAAQVHWPPEPADQLALSASR